MGGFMGYRAILFFVATLFLSEGFGNGQRFLKILEESEPIIEKALRDYQVPGLAIGVVGEGGLVYAKGFGWRDLEKKLPVTPDTVFQIGSCSKAFTSFLVGTLVDEGLLSWDSRLIDLYPEFRLQDEYATLHATVRDLLAHRSGLPRHVCMWYGSSTLSQWDVMDRLRYLEPSADLRERSQYGDLMYLAMGCCMERMMGKSWEMLVSERILHPLGMNQTGFSVIETQKGKNFAIPYRGMQKIPFRNLRLIGPAGGLHSTVNDLAKWVSVHLNDGRFHGSPVISSIALQETHAPQSIVTGAPESNESQIYLCGLGWKIIPYRGYYFVSHDGAVDGFTSVVGIFPKEKFGIIVLTNRNLTGVGRYLSNYLNDRLLGLPPINWMEQGLESMKKNEEIHSEHKQKEDLTRKIGTKPSHPLEEYVGVYTHPGYGVLTIEMKEGRLISTINELRAFLDHWHYDVFVLTQEAQEMIHTREGMKFSFQTGVNGAIESLSVPFESAVKEIVFKKELDTSLSMISYLKQFVGVYEIYGSVVEIVLRGGVLCGVLPGEPPYELVPEGKNGFVIKSLGHSVHFILDQNNKVEKAILSLPYGSFSATPRNQQ